MKQRKETVVLLILILLYLILEISQIKLPGLFCDEALEAAGTLQIMKHIKGPLLPSIRIFGRYFPLMRFEYHGAVESYFTLPFFLLFGVNVISLRLMPISFGVLTLVFTYLFAKRFFNQKVALFTILLLVINPSFILGTKFGNDNGSIIQMMSIGALLSFLMWHRKKKNILFCTGMFLLGLGLTTRIWFLWFIVALFIASIIFIKDIKEMILKNKLNYFILLLVGIMAFCLGAFLIICYNLTDNFTTIRYIINHFTQSKLGVNNFDYLNNFLKRIQDLTVLLNGRWFCISGNQLYPWLFISCLIWLVFSILFRRKTYLDKRKILFLLLLVFFIFLQSPFTLSSFGGTHLLILFPFLQLILAVALIDIVNFFKERKKFIAIILGIFLIPILTDLNVIMNHYFYYNKTGGEGNYSDAIYQLAGWLKEKGTFRPLAMDWGLYYNLIVITDAKVIPRCFSYIQESTDVEPERTLLRNRFIEDFRKIIESKDRIYLIFHTPEFTRCNCYEDVLKIAKEVGKDLVEEKRFYQRNGKLIYLVYSTKPFL